MCNGAFRARSGWRIRQAAVKTTKHPAGLDLCAAQPVVRPRSAWSMLMTLAGQTAGSDFVPNEQAATAAAEALLADAAAQVRSWVPADGRNANVDREQRATHGLAWLATYVEAVRQIVAYAERLEAAGQFGEFEQP